MKEVKGKGGVALAQDERQAKFDGMPRNAIDTGLVDFVFPVERMGDELMNYSQHPYVGSEQVRTEKSRLRLYEKDILPD